MTNTQLDRLDRDLRAPLEQLLSLYPGGVCAIEDLDERRRVEAQLAAEVTERSAVCARHGVVAPHVGTLRFRAFAGHSASEPCHVTGDENR